jgi:hypothetical protein
MLWGLLAPDLLPGRQVVLLLEAAVIPPGSATTVPVKIRFEVY